MLQVPAPAQLPYAGVQYIYTTAPLPAPALAPAPATASAFYNTSTFNPATGIGLTTAQAQHNMRVDAARSGANEPQDFKPADPNPMRQYWCREVDNTYLLRSRYKIEQPGFGPYRWYVNEKTKAFYAVRLPRD